GRFRKHERSYLMGTIAQSRRHSVRDARSGCSSKVECFKVAMPRREQHGPEREDERARELWQPRGSRVETSCASAERRPERSHAVQTRWEVAETNGYARQSQRENDFRYRCQSARNALRNAAALSGLWWKSEEL